MPSSVNSPLGRHYTPADIARRMVREGVASALRTGGTGYCRVLDPACGDGAFLLEVLDDLASQVPTVDHCQTLGSAPLRPDAPSQAFPSTLPHGNESSGAVGSSAVSPSAASEMVGSAEWRLKLVRDCIFGVDIDPVAVARLRRSLLDRIQPYPAMVTEAEAFVNARVRCGDALTGPDWKPDDCLPFVGEVGQPDGVIAADELTFQENIDWGKAFPDVARAGGFDLVVGNPPYLREKDGRDLFRRLRESSLGSKWHEARMDLWHYFVHRSLDLLRPGGVLTFIVNSYWTASRGASRLIGRLERETRLELIEELGDTPLFKGVAGRHLIFRLTRNPASPGPERRGAGWCRVTTSDRPERLIPHQELFHEGRLVLAPEVRLSRGTTHVSPLGDRYDTRQGLAENPPCITRRMAEEFPDRYQAGEGVFVLRDDELARLALSDRERSLLRPYFATNAMGRYQAPQTTDRHVLYLTRATAPTLEGMPHLAAHLERFRPILERRRETQRGRCAWWHLHWPRLESVFVQPRILSVQMGRRPQFAWAEHPTFVGFSINLVLASAKDAPSLLCLTGLLNSNLAMEWFERHAKRRGIHLEINGHVLKGFPIPERQPPIEAEIERLVRIRQALVPDDPQATEIENSVERLVETWYGV
ncbi:MAG: Eco57I restriction-modification methylase domain-containing protein [Planctomycetales bacterium]